MILFWGNIPYRWLGTRNGWQEMESLKGKEYSIAFRRALILGLVERADRPA